MTPAPAPVHAHRVVALLGALAVLSGCGPSTDPVRWPADPDTGIPAIDWPVGAPDTSDEWVAGLLDAQIALAIARNTHDYSSPHLADLVDPEQITDRAIEASERGEHHVDSLNESVYPYYPGPVPMHVRDVSVDGDRATVETCQFSLWATSEPEPATVEQVLARKRGSLWIYQLRRADDGHIVLVDLDSPARGCELDAPRPGYFDPAPPFGVKVMYTDVIGPDGHPVAEPRG